jgi:taurine dioxygenase
MQAAAAQAPLLQNLQSKCQQSDASSANGSRATNSVTINTVPGLQRGANVMTPEPTTVRTFGGERPGAEIVGMNLADADQACVEWIKRQLAEHGVLAFRDQELTPPQYIRLTKLFGELEPSTREQYWHPEHPDIYVISNVVENGRPIGNPNDGFAWHTDQYYFERPTAYTFLYGIETPPEGGDTQFSSTYELYDELPDALKQKYGKTSIVASHSKLNAGRLHPGQEERFPDIAHPLVRKHPITGRKFLYFSSKLASNPLGMTQEEFDGLHAGLIRRATQPERVYSHKWRKGDLVIWDNRGLLHTATAYDKKAHRRICYRISVIGEKPLQ